MSNMPPELMHTITIPTDDSWVREMLTESRRFWSFLWEPVPMVLRYQPARGVTRDTKDTFHIPAPAGPTDCEWIATLNSPPDDVYWCLGWDFAKRLPDVMHYQAGRRPGRVGPGDTYYPLPAGPTDCEWIVPGTAP
jgi:hypothetical protein